LEEERGKKDVEKTAPMQKPKLIIQDSRRVKAARCLCCGSPNDAATGIATHHGDRDTPKPGDVMMCFYCGHLMEMGQRRRLYRIVGCGGAGSGGRSGHSRAAKGACHGVEKARELTDIARQFVDQPTRAHAEDAGKLQEFNHIDPAVAAFDPRHPCLRAAELACHFLLAQSGPAACIQQALNQGTVPLILCCAHLLSK